MKFKHKTFVQQLLLKADVQIDGKRPWDIQVNNNAFYQKVIAQGTLGLGEAYVDGWWDCEALDEFFYRALRADLRSHLRLNARSIIHLITARIANLQSRSRALTVGKVHYDIGNDLYQSMLDPRMMYSCGYWKNADNLNDAQEAKLELVCQKLALKPGLKILDIGCGWGGFATYAAEKYDVEVVGITISKAQHTLAQKRCEGLPIEIRLQDYRDLTDTFDRIVSIGMFEHVGLKNYRTFMQIVSDCMDADGMCLLHTISENQSRYVGDPWTEKYIFPNGKTPSIAQLSKALEGLFVIEDIHNIGPHYAPTCLAWYQNFQNAWPKLKANYDERFFRMWRYYLLLAAGNFRARFSQVQQIVMTKIGRPQPNIRN